MKKFLSVMAVVFSLGIATASMDADAAKRMGSGKSLGAQREAVQNKAPAAQTSQNTAPAAGATTAAAPKPSWAGPIAGLAAGLGIAALASHFGFGEELTSMVMIGLLALAVMGIIGFFMRRRAQAGQTGMQAPPGLMPATIGSGTHSGDNGQPPKQAPAYRVSMPSGASDGFSGTSIGSGIKSAGSGVADRENFDRTGFERNAKANFIRLQAAYDAGNLDDIREFTTPEMFAELKLDLGERGAGTQHGEVMRLDAKVLEVVEEHQRYLVSIHFTGFIRYGAGADDETFDEIWNLTKPREGSGGWLVAGIQQAS